MNEKCYYDDILYYQYTNIEQYDKFDLSFILIYNILLNVPSNKLLFD